MEVFNVRLPWAPQIIMPINDIQYDGPGGVADLKRLKKHLEWGMERNALFIGLGDFVDLASPSERSRLQAADYHETTQQRIDNAATLDEEELMEVLRPTKGRWIGLVEGHHYYHHLDGTTSDTRFAEALETQFLGSAALGRITFVEEKEKGVVSIKVFAHHGTGGSGVLPTGALNKLYHQKAGYPGVRLFMQGHVPQLATAKLEGLDITDQGNPHIIHSDTHFVVCGGWVRAFKQGSTFAGRPSGGYAERGMMRPAVLGGPIIYLTPERTWNGSKGRSTTRAVRVEILI